MGWNGSRRGKKRMTENNLGYMERDTWDRLTHDDKLYYLYDAAINRCKECVDKFEPKRSMAWKASYLSLIAICAAVGGFLAQVLGFSK